MEQLSQTISPFPRLFEPGFIGGLRLKNRIVMPPMGTQFASPGGAVTPRMIDHYVRRARGGVGLIIVEFTCVDYPRGKGHFNQLALDSDALIAGHSDLVDAVHRAGAKIAVQLHHAGGNTHRGRTEGVHPVAPGLFPSRLAEEQPHILATDEIPALVEKFAQAVRRAESAGYDAVELHGAHGYLIGEFMSPYVNKREDEYGGSLEKRMRFPREIISRAKRLVGDDFPITMRISGQEFVPGGRTLGETKEVAQILEAAGLAGLHVSAGVDTDLHWMVDPIMSPEGARIHLAAGVKEAVSIPVIGVGVIREPAFAEDILVQGKADFVAIGRGLLTDPDWPRKAAEGRTAEIRKCISCNYCDGTLNTVGRSIRCVVNTEVGRGEKADAWPAPLRSKKVLVVGGGLAGMEAARVAALRGHQVTLFEKSDSLGGQLLLAIKAPGKKKLEWLLEDLNRELAKSSVDVRTNSPVEPQTVRDFAPDALVLAVGGEPIVPAIAGIDSNRVVSSWSLLTGEERVTGSRCVVIGANSTGCEISLLLAADPGNHVVIVEQLSTLARDMEPFARSAIREEIYRNERIHVSLGWKASRITPTGVEVVDRGGLASSHEADCVVLAVGTKPADSLNRDLIAACGPATEIYSVGDGARVGTIDSALDDGRTVGALL